MQSKEKQFFFTLKFWTLIIIYSEQNKNNLFVVLINLYCLIYNKLFNNSLFEGEVIFKIQISILVLAFFSVRPFTK